MLQYLKVLLKSCKEFADNFVGGGFAVNIV